MYRRCRRCEGERGASLVEFALILPIFMMLVLGMFSGGMSYNQKLSLTNAARDGARYGATLSKTALNGTQWANAVKEVALERASGDLKEGDSPDQGVCVALVGSDGSTIITDGSSPPKPYRYKTSGWSLAPPDNCYSDSLTGDTGCRVHVLLARKGKIEALLFTIRPTMKSSGTTHFEASCP